jgi:hypothetical protein
LAELRQLQGFPCHRQEGLAIRWLERTAEAAGYGGCGVDGLSGDHLEHLGAHVPHPDHALGDIRHGSDDADHVADRILRVGPHHEVRAGEDVEVQDMLFHVGDAVAQPPQLLPGGRDGCAEDRVRRLGRGQVVRPGAHAADPSRDARHLLDRLADAESLEAAQLDDVHAGIRDVSGIV